MQVTVIQWKAIIAEIIIYLQDRPISNTENLASLTEI